MTTPQAIFSLLLDGLNTGHKQVNLTQGQLSRFPEAAIQALKTQELLQPAAEASVIACPGCEDHCFMPVSVLPQTLQREARRFIDCDSRDEMGRIPIEPWRVLQQRFTLTTLLAWLGQALAQEPEVIVPDTLWRFGETTDKGFPVFFCLGPPDKAIQQDLLAQTLVAQRKIGMILTTMRESPEAFYQGACVLPLRSLVVFRENTWVFEGDLLGEFLRRQAIERAGQSFVLDTLVLECQTRTVEHGGRSVILPPYLFRLLLILAEARGAVVTRDDIEKRYHNIQSNEQYKTIPTDKYVANIHRKLANGVNKEAYPLESVLEIGYRLKERYKTILIIQ